jgi:hypothetical protein
MALGRNKGKLGKNERVRHIRRHFRNHFDDKKRNQKSGKKIQCRPDWNYLEK